MSTFTVRPSNSEKEAFRVKLTAVSLLSLKLRSGDLCTLHLSTDEDDQSSRIGVAWESSGNGMKDTVVQTSKTFQELHNLKLGDRVSIKRSSEKLQDATTIALQSLGSPIEDNDQTKWSLFASATIPVKHDIVAPLQKLMIEIGNQKEEFEVIDIGGPIGRVTSHTTFTFGSVQPVVQDIRLDFSRIGGLQLQLQQIEAFVKRLIHSKAQEDWRHYKLRQGLLLYGAKGTGKSLIQDTLSQCGWSKATQWSPGTKVTTTSKPQLVTIDFDSFSDKMRIVPEIISFFDVIRNSPTLVVGTVRHPNDVPERLRSKQTFTMEMELPIPDADQRLDILRTLRDDSQQPADEDLKNLAARTHGFVGADLDMLLHEAWDICMENGHVNDEGRLWIMKEDVEQALAKIRPSALQEIFLEKPNVHWSDIGGQHEIKRQLQNAVERPLKYPERMKLLGLQAKKGVLLYGPPGCSKTLTVKALATEADLNFLAVKGAELISMYVGESEKATREVFRKARQASPSIIFFDEIDAIASRGRSGSDLNVLTTLLNEMDGFEELRNVLVVAATNKPQSIDPALMRPGRFDNVVYVGPPDFETRQEIFDKKFANINVEDQVKVSTAKFADDTEGFSGAEVVAICQTAGEYAFDADRDFITVDDVQRAIQSTPKSITSALLEEYEQWNASRMR